MSTTTTSARSRRTTNAASSARECCARTISGAAATATRSRWEFWKASIEHCPSPAELLAGARQVHCSRPARSIVVDREKAAARSFSGRREHHAEATPLVGHQRPAAEFGELKVAGHSRVEQRYRHRALVGGDYVFGLALRAELCGEAGGARGDS